MRTLVLYKNIISEDEVVISLKNESKSDGVNIMYRMIADEDKLLTKDGEDNYTVLDVDNVEGWYEVDRPKKKIETITKPAK